jgi:hypothetical protein
MLKRLSKLSKQPDRKVDIKDNHLGIKLIPMISTWDQVDPTFPVRKTKFMAFFKNDTCHLQRASSRVVPVPTFKSSAWL